MIRFCRPSHTDAVDVRAALRTALVLDAVLAHMEAVALDEQFPAPGAPSVLAPLAGNVALVDILEPDLQADLPRPLSVATSVGGRSIISLAG
jgi:hypothetical protein